MKFLYFYILYFW